MLKKDSKQALEQTLKENGDMVAENNQLKNQIEELKRQNHALNSDCSGMCFQIDELKESRKEVLNNRDVLRVYNNQLKQENKTYEGIISNLQFMVEDYKKEVEILNKKLIAESKTLGIYKDSCHDLEVRFKLLYSLIRKQLKGK